MTSRHVAPIDLARPARQVRRLQIYAGCVSVTAVSLAVGLVASGWTLGGAATVLGLAAFALIAERSEVRLSSTTSISVSTVPTAFAAVLFGPLAAMLVAAAAILSDLRATTTQPFLKWATYSSTRALTGAIVGLTAVMMQRATEGEVFGLASAAVVGVIVSEVLEALFASVARRLRGNGSALELLRTVAPLLAVAVPFYAPLVAILAVAYEQVSPWTLPLFLGPALAAQRLFILYQEQRTLTSSIAAANQRLERANLSFATALVATLDARDQYTAGHSAAVATYARDIAARMGLDEHTQALAHLSGLVHDVGKIGLPVGLLEKEGPLTLEERRIMESHCEIGERILENVEDYSEVARIVRHHHERVDGQGYPDRLAGDDIPLLSRVIAVADAYDAMTSHRPYRDAMPSRVARLRLAQAVESQFDTTIVAAFEAILAGAGEEYRLGGREASPLVTDSTYPEVVALPVSAT